MKLPERGGVPMILWIISGKNAIQVFMMFGCVASGLALLLGAETPNSINYVLPRPLVYVWGACLLTGGLANLVGSWMTGPPERGLVVEYWSCLLLMVASLVYPVALYIYAKDKSIIWVPAGWLVIFALSCLGRAGQVRKNLREVSKLRKIVEEGAAQ